MKSRMTIKIKGAHVVFHRLLKAANCSSVQAILLCKRTQDAPTPPRHWALIGLPLFYVPVVMRVFRTHSPCLEEGGA
jgi:hypothetical protein